AFFWRSFAQCDLLGHECAEWHADVFSQSFSQERHLVGGEIVSELLALDCLGHWNLNHSVAFGCDVDWDVEAYDASSFELCILQDLDGLIPSGAKLAAERLAEACFFEALQLWACCDHRVDGGCWHIEEDDILGGFF